MAINGLTLNLDCNCSFPINLVPIGIPIGAINLSENGNYNLNLDYNSTTNRNKIHLSFNSAENVISVSFQIKRIANN